MKSRTSRLLAYSQRPREPSRFGPVSRRARGNRPSRARASPHRGRPAKRAGRPRGTVRTGMSCRWTRFLNHTPGRSRVTNRLAGSRSAQEICLFRPFHGLGPRDRCAPIPFSSRHRDSSTLAAGSPLLQGSSQGWSWKRRARSSYCPRCHAVRPQRGLADRWPTHRGHARRRDGAFAGSSRIRNRRCTVG